MRVLLFAALAALSAECTRAPAEDFPSRTTAPPPAAAASQSLAPPPAPEAEARCVKMTPAAPPPPVAPGPAAGCPRDPEGPQKVPVLHVAFPDAGGVGVDAEFVSSEHDTQRGLMYRKSMPEGRGMLFRLEERRDQEFWMHNTCIPLDLVYVDDDGFVVGIVENAPTLNDDPRGVGCPSHYVLEVNAGWTRKHGVKAGQHMTIPPEAR
ncbi:MAG TPA: DUF192 domain-containing protein [Polyangiaceae bacterium]